MVTVFQQANQLLREGKLEEAVVAYRRAISHNPDFYLAYHNLGEALEKLGHWDEAVGVYRRAVDLKPETAWSLLGLSRVLSHVGRVEEAQQASNQAVKIEPKLAELAKSLQDESRDDVSGLSPDPNQKNKINLGLGFNNVVFETNESLRNLAHLNILLPSLSMQSMSGGPNTAVSLAYRMANLGVPIRLISVDLPVDSDPEPLWQHMIKLSGINKKLPNVEIVDAHDRSHTVLIGEKDIFLATAWWTAQMVKYALPKTLSKKFIYLIQDFETLIHPASSAYALALETYSLNYYPIVNSKLLYEYFSKNKVGKFQDIRFAQESAILEPAIDRSKFFFEEKPLERKRKLLFYARPTVALRNLFEIGVSGLQLAIQRGVFKLEEWEFLGMGELFTPIPLGNSEVLLPLTWKDFDGYTKQMREADILLSLMLSPHPSYPPLEMAACGNLVVTNSFECKTAERMSNISQNILAAEPTIEQVAENLRIAVNKLADIDSRKHGSETINLPKTWEESFAPVIPKVLEVWESEQKNNNISRLEIDKEPCSQTSELNNSSKSASILDEGKEKATEGDWDSAVRFYNHAVNLDSKSADAYHHLAYGLTKLERWKDAIYVYQQAIYLNPFSPLLHQRIGDALTTLNRLSEAQASYKKAEELISQEPQVPYELYRFYRKRQRNQLYSSTQENGLLTFVTTVWNTDPKFLEALANSVFNQEGGTTNLKWFILDNGSENQETKDFLKKMKGHNCVTLERVEKNIGIIGGMRYCLERVSSRYFLPLDSDDYLEPDCIKIITYYIHKHNYPPLLFTDEDKLLNSNFCWPYFKPDWDPVLFVNSCYIAHLCVISRDLALNLNAYTDPKAEGSHDWDTFTRFLCTGYSPVHIPEVLYSWRMHEQSTSSNITSKPYIFDSQTAVLEKFIKSQANPNLYWLDKSPLFGNSPDWWIRRHHRQPLSITTIVLLSNDNAQEIPKIEIEPEIPHQIIGLPLSSGCLGLRKIIKSLKAPKHLIHLISDRVELEPQFEWTWEVMALMEMFPDTVMIGGRIYSENSILSAGYYFGFDWGCGCPDRGRSLSDPGYFAQLWKQHSVNAVSSQNAVVDSIFLDQVLEKFGDLSISLQGIGYWVGALAKNEGKRIIYSPLLSAKTDLDWNDMISQDEKTAFICLNYKLLSDTSLLSPHLGLTKETAYHPVIDTHRKNHLNSLRPKYHKWLNTEILLRSAKYPLIPNKGASFSVLTTVYIRTNAALFLETAESLFQQTYGFNEWIILVHGPISNDLDSILEFISTDSRVKILRLPENLGIVGGMKICLEAASQEYIIPMDADDLLTYDALQVISWNIINYDHPDFLYADEDMMIEGVPSNPYFRPDWDPILNLASSYVWHPCAFRLDTAIEVGVYSDTGANFCHDWDTIFKFSRANKKIIHITEILYHWRQHTNSLTNKDLADSGSIKSVRYVLEKEVSRQANPELYEIVSFPIFRGSEELYILRRPIEPPPLEVIIISETKKCDKLLELKQALQTHNFPFSAIHICTGLIENNNWESLLSQISSIRSQKVVVLFDTIIPKNDYWSWEALKLFDFHQDLALVGGRIFDLEGKIVTGAEVMNYEGNIISPYHGLQYEEPGPYALALKPQTVHFVPSNFFVADTNFIRQALTLIPQVATLNNIGIWLGVIATQQNKSVAFSPLIYGNFANDPQISFGLCGLMNNQERLWLHQQAKNLFFDRCFGASGFVDKQWFS